MSDRHGEQTRWAHWWDRSAGESGGYTLVEIMVVVVIIAVLVAIAIPTFIRFRSHSQDTRTQHELVSAAKLEAGMAPDGGGYADGTALALEEPGLDFSGATTESLHVVVADLFDGGGDLLQADGQVLIYARSQSGTWFGIHLIQEGTFAGRHTCSGVDADAVGASDMTVCLGNAW